MKDVRSIWYRCNVCHCEFGIDEKYVILAEENGAYITCPLFGKHKITKKLGLKNVKVLMEEKKAVLL